MKRFLLTCAIAALTACTTSNNDKDFLCGAQDGQPCRTMSEVDGRGNAAPATPTASPRTTTQQTIASGTGVRVPEQTGRMWVAPYNDGRYIHEGSTVRFVVRNARWSQQ